jgi:hypothetical protein
MKYILLIEKKSGGSMLFNNSVCGAIQIQRRKICISYAASLTFG